MSWRLSLIASCLFMANTLVFWELIITWALVLLGRAGGAEPPKSCICGWESLPLPLNYKLQFGVSANLLSKDSGHPRLRPALPFCRGLCAGAPALRSRSGRSPGALEGLCRQHRPLPAPPASAHLPTGAAAAVTLQGTHPSGIIPRGFSRTLVPKHLAFLPSL